MKEGTYYGENNQKVNENKWFNPFKGSFDNFSQIPQFFSFKNLRFWYH